MQVKKIRKTKLFTFFQNFRTYLKKSNQVPVQFNAARCTILKRLQGPLIAFSRSDQDVYDQVN